MNSVSLLLCLAILVTSCRTAAPLETGEPLESGEPADAVRTGTPAGVEGHTVVSNAGTWRIVWRARPDTIPLDEPFGLTVWVLDPGTGDAPRRDVALVVDAGMPQHQHGMNRVPTLAARDDGGFDVDGLLFHMPGTWTLFFDVQQGGITERAQCTVELE